MIDQQIRVQSNILVRQNKRSMWLAHLVPLHIDRVVKHLGKISVVIPFRSNARVPWRLRR